MTSPSNDLREQEFDGIDHFQAVVQELIEEDKTPFKANSHIVAAVIAEQIAQEWLPALIQSELDKQKNELLDEFEQHFAATEYTDIITTDDLYQFINAKRKEQE